MEEEENDMPESQNLEIAPDDQDSDNEPDPYHSSDDSDYSTDPEQSESDEAPGSDSDDDLEQQQLNQSFLVGTGNRPYAKYTKRRRVDMDDVKAPTRNLSYSNLDDPGPSTMPTNRSQQAQQVNSAAAQDGNDFPLDCNGRPILNLPAKQPKTRKDVLAKIAAGAEAFECPLCHVLLLSKVSQERHTENHYKAKVVKPPIICPRCNKEYKCKSAMEKHMNESECWREWTEGPMSIDTSANNMELPDDGEPLKDLSGHNPGMLFSEFFTPLLKPWKKYTNKAGAKLYTKEKAKQHKRSAWYLFKKLEAYKIMTMFIAWGLLGLDRMRDPWKKDWLFNNPFYTTWTSGNRFQQIMNATHFVDNEYETDPRYNRRGCPGSPTYDRLWRIRDVINEFCRVSQANWKPGRNITIDEMMVLFKGRWGHVTLMPKKPIKKGIKLFALADANNGYVLNFIPSTGEHYPEYPILKKTGATLVALLRGDNLPEGWSQNYLYRGHYLFTDNYYTAFKTIEWLRRNGIFYCGTIRKDKRRVPDFMKVTTHRNGRPFIRGEMKFAHSNTGIQLCLWLDSKIVLTASNLPDVTNQRKQCERVLTYMYKKKKVYLGRKTDLPQPEVVWLYNKFMKGIDLSDQLISKCHHQFRSKKWFIPIWYQLIDLCILNSFVIYKFYYKQRFPNAPPLTTPVFRRMIVESLRNHVEQIEGPEVRLPQVGQTQIVNEMPHEHLPLLETLNVEKLSHAQKMEIAKKRIDHVHYNHTLRKCARVRCHVHWQDRRTEYCCAVCRIPMCPTPCSDRFHFSYYYKFNDPSLGKRKNEPKMSHPFL